MWVFYLVNRNNLPLDVLTYYFRIKGALEVNHWFSKKVSRYNNHYTVHHPFFNRFKLISSESCLHVYLYLFTFMSSLLPASPTRLYVHRCVCAPTTHPEPPYSLQILGHVLSETTVSKQFLLVLIEASEVIMKVSFCAEVQPQIKYSICSIF